MKTFRILGLRWSIIAVACATSIIVIGMVGFQIWRDHETALTDARNDTASIATSLNEHARQVFAATDLLMQGMLKEVQQLPSLDHVDRGRLHQELKTLATGANFIKALAIMDASGRRIATADTKDPEPISFVDRPHFFIHEAQKDVGLYIGAPIQGIAGPTKDETLLPITRRIETKDGRFAGVIYAGLPISYFLDFYKSLQVEPQVSVRLMLSDGTLLVSQSTHVTGLKGYDWHPLFKGVIRDQPSGTFEGPGLDPFKGTEVISYRSVPGFPLVVTVSMNRDEVLAPWRAMTKASVVFVAALLLATVGAAVWLLRMESQRERLLRDVTTEKLRAEKAVEEARDADRAKSAFLATISHEIRTPMNGVIGFSELLLETALDGRQREYVTTVYDSARALLVLLNDVLDYSKIEAGKIDLESLDFDPLAIAKGVTALFLRQAESKGLSLSLRAAPGIPNALRGDANRLRQVLTNLVSNAIKFTERGAVNIDLSVVGHGMDWVALRFAVKDSGIGISEDAKNHLFNRFSQADSSIARRFGGTGLGLAICKSLVDLMGGEIGVSSRVGEGSTFWFTVSLPLAVAAIAPSREAPMATRKEKSGTALVVDDVEINRRLVSVMLAGAGYRVEEAAGGREALARLAKGGIDVVLLDLQMPGMDGFETAVRIRTLLGAMAKVPLIAMTANAMNGIIEQCLSAGMNGYIKKPATKTEVLAAIANISPHWQAADLAEKRREQDADANLPMVDDKMLDDKVLDELEGYIGRAKVTECVHLLVSQIAPAAACLSAGARAGDLGAVERETHSLISPLGSLGLACAAKLARELTDAVRSGTVSRTEVTIRVELFTRACEDGLAALKRRYPDAEALPHAASA